MDPQLSRLFYDSDSECGESVSSAGPPAPEPEPEYYELSEATPEIRQALDAELLCLELWGDNDVLSSTQLAIQKIGKAARGEELAGRVADSLASSIIAKINRLVCDENGDRLEKRRSTAPDVDVAEFRATWEDPSTPAGRLLDQKIEEDDPNATRLLRAREAGDRAAEEAAIKGILSKS